MKPALEIRGHGLTAWELGKQGVPYTLITDNAGGHLMQNGMVDLVFVGCDRATRKRGYRQQDRDIPESAFCF